MGNNEQMGRREGIRSTLEVHDRLLRGQDASTEAERAEKHVNFRGNGPSKGKAWGREKMANKGNIELLRARGQGTPGAHHGSWVPCKYPYTTLYSRKSSWKILCREVNMIPTAFRKIWRALAAGEKCSSLIRDFPVPQMKANNPEDSPQWEISLLERWMVKLLWLVREVTMSSQ